VPVIELKKLTKFFGAVPAVLEASLTVEEGDFFGFVGPNGSGKSTTIRMMMNYVRPTSGTATILGMDSRSQSGKLKKMVGYVPSEVDYYMDMRAMEVIRYAAAMRGLRDKSRIDQLCDLFEVDTVRRISHMSLGNRKKIALVTALLHSPKLLILDEPTSGLDPVSRDELLKILSEYIEDGEHSVMFSTHITGDLERAADYITYISYGELYFTGSKDDFVDMFRIVKGGIEELSDDLKNKAAGIRTFPTGFEALMKTEDINDFSNLTVEPATIDEIVVFTSKKGDDYE